MRIVRHDTPGLIHAAKEDVESGYGYIQRFWGQTRIWMPMEIAERIGEKRLREIILEFFPQESLSGIDGICYNSDCVQLELPGVLDCNGGKEQIYTEKYQKPDRLLERILAETTTI